MPVRLSPCSLITTLATCITLPRLPQSRITTSPTYYHCAVLPPACFFTTTRLGVPDVIASAALNMLRYVAQVHPFMCSTRPTAQHRDGRIRRAVTLCGSATILVPVTCIACRRYTSCFIAHGALESSWPYLARVKTLHRQCTDMFLRRVLSAHTTSTLTPSADVIE